MVVSGLPIRNGDLHAGEIATIALDVISSMVGFKIKHMEGKTLQLKRRKRKAKFGENCS
jgi:hypothetical protein